MQATGSRCSQKSMELQREVFLKAKERAEMMVKKGKEDEEVTQERKEGKKLLAELEGFGSMNSFNARNSKTEALENKPIIEQKAFQFTVFFLIITNAIVLGMATNNPELEDDVWKPIEHFFTAAFLLEAMIKIFFMHLKYFADPWNFMDFSLVMLSIIDAWILSWFSDNKNLMSQLTILRLFRILRVARMLRMLRAFKELWMIVRGILMSFKTMFWISILLMFVLYAFSILCVSVIGHPPDIYASYDRDHLEDWPAEADFNNYQYFGTMFRSMYTLFNIVILTEWPEIGRAVMEKQPHMIPFFIAFIVFTTFGIMNVIIGVIVDSTTEAAKSVDKEADSEAKRLKLETIHQIEVLIYDLDQDNTGSISREELHNGLKRRDLQQCWEDLHLPRGFNESEIMDLLDMSGDGELTNHEFIKSFYRLVESNNDPFQAQCLMTCKMNQILRGIRRLTGEVPDGDGVLSLPISPKPQSESSGATAPAAAYGSASSGASPTSNVNSVAVYSGGVADDTLPKITPRTPRVPKLSADQVQRLVGNVETRQIAFEQNLREVTELVKGIDARLRKEEEALTTERTGDGTPCNI